MKISELRKYIKNKEIKNDKYKYMKNGHMLNVKNKQILNKCSLTIRITKSQHKHIPPAAFRQYEPKHGGAEDHKNTFVLLCQK